ncbi:trihelix transcription factor GTL1-like [Pyrus communis]|uniref:trihelix transcription factor GTL1-like n=1 Tax=Pyrus communis TaxID=23211 RepID=UPI0035C2017A
MTSVNSSFKRAFYLYFTFHLPKFIAFSPTALKLSAQKPSLAPLLSFPGFTSFLFFLWFLNKYVKEIEFLIFTVVVPGGVRFMAELTGGRHLPNSDAFGEQISPFPESTYDLVFENPTPAVPSPPQKLRPVRGGGVRSPMDSGGKLEDVGPAKVGSGDELEDESSSSADDDDDRDKCLKAQGEEPMKRKRKTNVRTGNRLEIERVELFLESLVKKVMEQQEQMHKQLIEVIEKNEKERLAREEAWKQQVLDRLKRDKEIRAQETSRSLALISFIQNYLGSENQVPQPSPSPSPVPEQAPAPAPAPIPLSVVPNYDLQRMEGNGKADNGMQRDLMLVSSDATNRRWPEAEVQALITLWAAFEHKFHVAGNPKGRIWEEISVKMGEMGYVRSGRKCREKWENINKYFRRCMGPDSKRSANAKLCPYFHELELLHKSGLVSFGNGFNRTSNQNEANIEKQEQKSEKRSDDGIQTPPAFDNGDGSEGKFQRERERGMS